MVRKNNINKKFGREMHEAFHKIKRHNSCKSGGLGKALAINGHVIEECASFEDFKKWFHNVFGIHYQHIMMIMNGISFTKSTEILGKQMIEEAKKYK